MQIPNNIAYIFNLIIKILKSEKCFLTLKQRADFPPAGDASLTGELTQGSLQEKHGDTAAHEEDDVWDEERAFMHTEEKYMQNVNTTGSIQRDGSKFISAQKTNLLILLNSYFKPEGASHKTGM